MKFLAISFALPGSGLVITIRHTARTWFRLSRAERNRLRQGRDARRVWRGP